MIGKAIHIILKDKISELNSGGIYPVVLPQNADYSIGASSNYPSIIYQQYIDYETSKDPSPNILYCRLNIHVISESYKTTNEISVKVRDVLDHYQDLSNAGIVDIPGYVDSDGYRHNPAKNIDIQHILYEEEDDEFFDDLKLFARRMEFSVYYFNDIGLLNYDQPNELQGPTKTPTNPLAWAFDFTQSGLLRNDNVVDTSVPDYESRVSNGGQVHFAFNKIGKVKDLRYNSAVNPVNIGNTDFYQYFKSGAVQPGYYPTWEDGSSNSSKGYLKFETTASITTLSTSSNPRFHMPLGAMIIMVYQPYGTESENYLMGSANQFAGQAPLIFSHKKVGSDITIHFAPNSTSFTGATDERTLITSTDSTKYWDAKYHFFCLSLGGCKAYTGGTYNQQGWFEYFNSDYNPKLTTGQIIKNNTIAGNTTNMTVGFLNFYFNRIGHQTVNSAGFRMYEFLMFIPNNKKTHNISDDAAPFQPTDIIYKKAKEYISNKYEL